jgi:hypothetical protein
MHVSIYVQITLKDRPDDFRGMTGESLVIGKTEATGLDEMLCSLFNRLADYYGLCAPAEILNDQLDEAAAYFQHVRFKPQNA